jgi:hypothetical protein
MLTTLLGEIHELKVEIKRVGQELLDAEAQVRTVENKYVPDTSTSGWSEALGKQLADPAFQYLVATANRKADQLKAARAQLTSTTDLYLVYSRGAQQSQQQQQQQQQLPASAALLRSVSAKGPSARTFSHRKPAVSQPQAMVPAPQPSGNAAYESVLDYQVSTPQSGNGYGLSIEVDAFSPTQGYDGYNGRLQLCVEQSPCWQPKHREAGLEHAPANTYLVRLCSDVKEYVSGKPNPNAFVLAFISESRKICKMKIYRHIGLGISKSRSMEGSKLHNSVELFVQDFFKTQPGPAPKPLE